MLDAAETLLVERYSAVNLPDASWESIHVPGYWDQPAGGWPWSDPNLRGGPHPEHDGEAWYRLHFQLPPDAYPSPGPSDGEHGLVGILRFEGVSAKVSVWLNGVFAGRNTGAFSPAEFEFPVDQIRSGTNVLSVRVRDKSVFYRPEARDHPNQSSLIPLGFDPRAGGIHRSVSLRIAPKERILDLFVMPNLQSLSIDVSVSDAAIGTTTFELTVTEKQSGARIYGPRLQPVRFDKKRYQGLTVSIANLPLAKPWSPESPVLYHMAAKLTGPKGGVDFREVDFGFRTFTAGKGEFLLNGKPYFLFGAGSPPHYENASEEAAHKHLDALKSAGVRVVRFAHEPPADMWLRMCDEIGLLAWVEGPLSADSGPYNFANSAFVNQATQETVRMVRSLRNHPSVAVWSIGCGNYAAIESSNEAARAAAANALKGMADIVSYRLVDPTRIAIPESNNRGELSPAIEDWHSDIGWYQGRNGDWPFFLNRWAAYRAGVKGGTAPWVSSELECGYSSNGQAVALSDPVEEAATRMRIGMPGDDTPALLEYQAARMKRLIEVARALRDPGANRIAGLFPFTSSNWFYNPLTPESFSPKPIVDAIRKAYSPVMIGMDQIRAHYFGGEILETTLTVVNDNPSGSPLSSNLLVCEVFSPEAKEPWSARGSIPPLPYYTSRTHSQALNLPEPSGIETARVRVRLVSGEAEIAANERTIRVGQPSFCRLNAKDISEGVFLYDPAASLTKLLESYKTPIPPFEDLNQLKRMTGLVIGADGFDHYVVRAWPSIEEWVRSGGRVFVLAQEKTDSRWRFSGPFPGGRLLSKPAGWPSGIDRVNLRIPEHPFFEGIKREDLADWGVNSVVAATVFEKGGKGEPSGVQTLTLADVVPSSAAIVWDDVVLEVRMGEGKILLCQLKLAEKSASDPIAARLLKNGVRWAGGAHPPILSKLPPAATPFKARLVGNNLGEVVAKGAGVAADDPLRAVPLPDGQFEAGSYTDKAGTQLPGIIPLSTTGQVYYDIDDRFWIDQPGSAEIQVEVLCRSASKICLDYDSSDTSLGTASAMKRTSSRPVTEVGVWKLLVFSLPDARFGNRQFDRSDFRLTLEQGEAIFGPITVRRLK